MSPKKKIRILSRVRSHFYLEEFHEIFKMERKSNAVRVVLYFFSSAGRNSIIFKLMKSGNGTRKHH